MKRIHCMGIGGSGMNAAAGIAHSLGYDVTGCDVKESEYTSDLVTKNIPIHYGHEESHLSDRELLCVSPAVYYSKAPEMEIGYAKMHEIPIKTWQQFMGEELQAGKKVIAVAGTKGKSTTTSLVGLLLEKAELDPTVAVGASVTEWEKNYRVGKSDYFVCEADEFNNNFLHYKPDIAIITNLEMDHPEFFGSFEEYITAYVNFVAQITDKGILIVCLDSPGIVELLKRIDVNRVSVITYGASDDAAYRLHSYTSENRESHFVITHGDQNLSYVSLLTGEHNALNTVGAVALADVLKIPGTVFDTLLRTFRGIGRRFELICEKNEIIVYNDYAHTPMSVRAVLKAARDQYRDARIWAVFQPHLYSRTKLFLDEFALSFGDANHVVISDIYASREKDKPIADEIHSQDLVDKIHELNPSIHVRYIGAVSDVVSSVLSDLKPGDVVVNMGAGDNGIISEELCQKIQ